MKSTLTSMPFTDDQLAEMLVNALGDSTENSDTNWDNAIIAHSFDDLTQQLAKRQKEKAFATTKTPVQMELFPEVLSFFKTKGQDWQTKINDVLMGYVKAQSM